MLNSASGAAATGASCSNCGFPRASSAPETVTVMPSTSTPSSETIYSWVKTVSAPFQLPFPSVRLELPSLNVRTGVVELSIVLSKVTAMLKPATFSAEVSASATSSAFPLDSGEATTLLTTGPATYASNPWPAPRLDRPPSLSIVSKTSCWRSKLNALNAFKASGISSGSTPMKRAISPARSAKCIGDELWICASTSSRCDPSIASSKDWASATFWAFMSNSSPDIPMPAAPTRVSATRELLPSASIFDAKSSTAPNRSAPPFGVLP